MAAPLCLFWSVWRERNTIVFDEEDISMHRMKFSFFLIIGGHGLIHVCLMVLVLCSIICICMGCR